MKILYFSILMFFYSCCNRGETCCQMCERLFGEENLNIDAFSKTDEANLKLIFEYSKNNEIQNVAYKKYKYKYREKDSSKIIVFPKEEFKKVGDYDINIDEDENVLNLFNFQNNEGDLEENKINIDPNNNWIQIGDFKKDLNLEEQNIVIKEDPTTLKTKTEKKLTLDFVDPGEHGIYIIKIMLNNNETGYVFIDYMVTIGELGGYYYEIKKIFFKSNEKKNFFKHSKNCKITKSNDGELNEFTFSLFYNHN